VALLARYGRGQFSLHNAGPGPEWLPFAAFAPEGAGPMQDVSLGAREEIPGKGEARSVEVAVRRMDCGSFAQAAGAWEVTWPLLGDLSFKFRYGPAGSEMAFDSHGARKYAPEFLLSLTWLYINGLCGSAARWTTRLAEAVPLLLARCNAFIAIKPASLSNLREPGWKSAARGAGRVYSPAEIKELVRQIRLAGKGKLQLFPPP